MNYYYLDLYNLFVNEVAGSWIIFLILMLIGIFYVAARYRYPDVVVSLVFIVAGMLFSPFSVALKAITILVAAVYIAWNLRRLYSSY